LAKSAVPISVDIKKASQAPLSGNIHVANFPLELFRRDANVERFDLALADPTRDSSMNGEIRLAYTDYTIRVLLLSTVGKPVIRFVSEPPLTEDQIVSVLLFGKQIDELDSDQAESVGRTRAAVADGALGLASLYVLASTPIESVGYDPNTGVATAKVRLAEGTSLNVASSTSNHLEEVGVRKRLGPHWTIDTELANPTSTGNRVVSAFLQWSNRY
jgi:hypothetical protein